jgi:hypothetical protein
LVRLSVAFQRQATGAPWLSPAAMAHTVVGGWVGAACTND